MFVIQISGVDSSCHTLEVDALVQRQRFIDAGVQEETVVVIEKNSFVPPHEV